MSGKKAEVKTEDERNRIKDTCSTRKKEEKQEKHPQKSVWGGNKATDTIFFIDNGWAEEIKEKNMQESLILRV